MSVKTTPIYQSGETVLISGFYKVVGVEYNTPISEEPVQEFEKGARFANYDGRAVCWHLLQAKAYRDEVTTGNISNDAPLPF